MSTPEAIANAVAIVAAGVSAVALVLAHRANKIAELNAWTEKLLGVAVEEIQSVFDEWLEVRQFYQTAFANLNEKRAAAKKLSVVRAGAARRLDVLKHLAAAADGLSSQRDEIELADDSFMHNDELKLDARLLATVLQKYQAAYAAYLRRVRTFIGTVCKSKPDDVLPHMPKDA